MTWNGELSYIAASNCLVFQVMICHSQVSGESTRREGLNTDEQSTRIEDPKDNDKRSETKDGRGTIDSLGRSRTENLLRFHCARIAWHNKGPGRNDVSLIMTRTHGHALYPVIL